MSTAPVLWLSGLANAILLLCLGLLLGVGVFKSFIKNPTAQANMDKLIAKLAPFQGTLGLIAIGVGGWLMIASVLFMAPI
jgi:hypothetical protein